VALKRANILQNNKHDHYDMVMPEGT